jgi:hypothetical protein
MKMFQERETNEGEKKTVFIFQRARNGKGFTLFGLLIPTKMLSDGWLLLLLLLLLQRRHFPSHDWPPKNKNKKKGPKMAAP